MALIAATIKAEATTPVLVETGCPYMECVTGDGGPCGGKWSGPQEWEVSTRGYHLGKIDVRKKSDEIVALKLFYDPDVASSGSTITSTTLGDST